MKDPYKRNELAFALSVIVLYCFLFSCADTLSAMAGMEYSFSAIFGILLSMFLLAYIRRSKLLEYYGLCLPSVNARSFFYYIPLLILSIGNAWNGFSFLHPPFEMVCAVVSMLCIGFLEAVIFRGLLIFADGTSSITVTSMSGKSFFRKFGIPKERLAFIANSTGSAVAWFVPFGSAAAVLVSFLTPVMNNLGLEENPFSLVLRAVPFHFFAIALMIVLFTTVITGKDLGPMKRAETEAGKVLLLELGVGYNTPGIIKYPFWKMAIENHDSFYVSINKGEAAAPDALKNRSLCINDDIHHTLLAINALGRKEMKAI